MNMQKTLHYKNLLQTNGFLQKALNFAKTLSIIKKVSITQEEKKIIYYSRKSLLLKDQETWIEKEGELFNVTMGVYDGADICGNLWN